LATLRGHNAQFFIVDDEESIARAGCLTLNRFGYAAECEWHVLKALARLENDPQAFQLVISGQTMSAITGLEFAARIHSLRPDLPVILESDHSAALTPERVRAAGARFASSLRNPHTGC